jgi:hypothetical protein
MGNNMIESLNVLIIEDTPAKYLGASSAIRENLAGNATVLHVNNIKECQRTIGKYSNIRIDIVICDSHVSDADGIIKSREDVEKTVKFSNDATFIIPVFCDILIKAQAEKNGENNIRRNGDSIIFKGQAADGHCLYSLKKNTLLCCAPLRNDENSEEYKDYCKNYCNAYLELLEKGCIKESIDNRNLVYNRITRAIEKEYPSQLLIDNTITSNSKGLLKKRYEERVEAALSGLGSELEEEGTLVTGINGVWQMNWRKKAELEDTLINKKHI